MTLHLSNHRNAEQQAELREARRLLRDKIRTDWEHPPLPRWKSSGLQEETATATATQSVEDGIAGFRFHDMNGVVGEALGLAFQPTEWREREYSSDAESDAESENAMTPARMSGKSKESMCRFDAPDSVGTQLQSRQQARKRKRWAVAHEEMEWNDGLAHWTKRRDLWCCARETRDVRMLEGSSSSNGVADREPIETDSASASAASSPRTSTSSVEAQVSTPESTPSVSPDVTGAAGTIPLDVLVPIAPALLPKHPVRKRMGQNMYPEIYNKIIIQSRTPSVPINLLTLINALVQGWKDDGEWPPKPGPLEKSFTRKKGGDGSLRSGVKAVGRVLRLTGVPP